MLFGVQLLVLMAVVGVGLELIPTVFAVSAPMGDRVAALPPSAEADVERALRAAAPTRALTRSEETALRSFLSLAAEGARTAVDALHITEGPPDPGGQRVLVRVVVTGDPLDVPIFLDGSAHLRALGLPERLEVDAVGPARVSVVLILSFLRPPVPDTGWVAGRLTAELPAAAPRAGLFEAAARLAALRAHQRAQDERSLAAEEARRTLNRALPPALLRLRAEGGSLTWTRGGPLRSAKAPG